MKLSQLSSPRPDLHLIDVLVERLAQQEGKSSAYQNTILEKARKAIHAGNLRVCDPETGFLIGDNEELSPLTKVEYFNDWLKSCGGQLLQDITQVGSSAAEVPATETLIEPNRRLTTQTAQSADFLKHSTKDNRRHSLRSEIEHAQSMCISHRDTTEVWAELQKLAEERYGALLGATEDGLQYLKSGEAAIFTRDALQKRLKRAAEKVKPNTDIRR
jgi:hypothetical protein